MRLARFPAARIRRVLAAALAGSLVTVSAHALPASAGPPYQTDDPEPTSFRHYEIYVNTQFAGDGHELGGVLPALEVNYGLMPNVQFSVTTELSGHRSLPAPWTLGMGDTEIALKVRFANETASRPQIAFYPAVVLANGDVDDGGSSKSKLFLPLWAQKSLGYWNVFGGGGWWHNPGLGNRDYVFTGIAVEREASEQFAYGAEVFHTTADTVGGSASTGFSVGVIRGLGVYHKVLFSVGRSLHGSNALTTYAAYEFALGPKGTKDEGTADR